MALYSIDEEYRALNPAEFFYKYREITGFTPTRALYQTIRELVENALDATDAYGIPPVVKAIIQQLDSQQNIYKVTVEDNGIGMPPHIVPDAFGRVLFSSKYVLKQTRGMYGLGVKMAVLYAQMTTGQPVEVITSRPGLKFIYQFKIRIDVKTNSPVIVERSTIRKNRDWHGTIVSLVLEGDWARSKRYIVEYFRRTAIALPYATLTLITPENDIVFYEKVVETVPKPPREVKPHPYGVDLELLKSIIASNTKYKSIRELLMNSFQSIGEVTAQNILQKAGIELDKDPKALSDQELLKLVEAMKNYDKYRAPKPDALSSLGAEIIIAGLKRMFKPEFADAITRSPATYQGNPFIVEAGIAYGGEVPVSEPDKPIILRYANKIPLLHDEGSDAITAVVKEDINWANYLVELPAPIVVLVHICSTKVPFKGVGKESIADIPEVRREIKLAVAEVARKLRKYLAKKKKEEEMRRKVVNIAKYIPEIARALTILSGSDGRGVEELQLVNKLVEIVTAKTGLPFNEVKKVVDSVEIGA